MDDFTNAFRGGYRKRAFFVQYNLIVLFGAAAFAAASASFVPLIVGAVAELLWIVSAPWFSSFRQWVDSHGDEGDVQAAEVFHLSPPISASPAASAAPPSSMKPLPLAPPAPSVRASTSAYPPPLPSVDAEYKERAKRLGVSLREIRMLADEELRRTRSEELTVALSTLSELAAAFDRVCQLHRRLTIFVAQTSKPDLEQEVAKLTDGFSREKDLGLRVTLRQAMMLAQRRLEQYGRVFSLQRATELRLDMIESAAAHVRSRGLTMASPDEFAADIRGLLTHVASVSALEQDSAEAPASRRTSALPPVTGFAAGDG